jgi:hypothetical protein
MTKRSTLLTGLGILVATATLSAGQLPHTGPGGRKTPPAPCSFTSRCAPTPCNFNPRQIGCRGGQLPPSHRGK